MLPPLSSARSTTPMQIGLVWHRNGPHVEAQVVEFANYLHSKILANSCHYGTPARRWRVQFGFNCTLYVLSGARMRPDMGRCAAPVELSRLNYSNANKIALAPKLIPC